MKQVYEHVSFVFQFAHQDHDLGASDVEKYMPWPLQPAGLGGQPHSAAFVSDATKISELVVLAGIQVRARLSRSKPQLALCG